MASDKKDSVRAELRKLYRGLGWPAWFARLKFYFAPLVKIERLVPKKGLIVDLGCGYGLFSNYLALQAPEREVIGLDLDERKISFANRGLAKVRCFLGDITKTEVPPADGIIFIHVLHHLPSKEAQEKLLRICVQKLKPGGRLVITEVDKQPTLKYLMCLLADKILYPKDRLQFRPKEEWENIFKNLPVSTTTIQTDKGTLFAHITFVCEKVFG